MDTEALYLEDSSVRRFDAEVLRTLDDPPRVVLDRTQFYPEGGGQPADRGVLRVDDREWTVTDVQKRDTIYHGLDGDPPEPGTAITGELDWDRRYAHMRYHTAQHLLSALLLDAYDAPTRGNQLYADRARIDVEHGRFTETDLADVEASMNGLVEDGRLVTWFTMDRERAERELDPERTRIELLPDSIRELRIVEIAGDEGPYDRTACAGTHVENTREIGTVAVTGRETGGSGRERLHLELEE
ncbi:alanyl-tRNA editing protein [Salinirubellus sp. GCM10025818]|jgi:misacylated tRNA(Ala) deacylase|uniref:alanyl-tRNA editing protein n=1 Tax=Salinirubellus TaxID=2162630 RepID=UPI0030CE782A